MPIDGAQLIFFSYRQPVDRWRFGIQNLAFWRRRVLVQLVFKNESNQFASRWAAWHLGCHRSPGLAKFKSKAQTIFICFLLGFGAMTFSQDANRPDGVGLNSTRLLGILELTRQLCRVLVEVKKGQFVRRATREAKAANSGLGQSLKRAG